jgi:nitrate reductase (cytochrome), electron transfer subunit
MKVMTGKWMIVLTLLAIAALLGCGATASKKKAAGAADGMDVWFRDGGLSAMTDQGLAVYGEAEPGDSKPYGSSWADAPPQIPHSLDGLVPILYEDNSCLECHLPENAVDMEATPIPESHFQNPNLVENTNFHGMRTVVYGYKQSSELAGSRYNCTLCHWGQADNVSAIENDF